LSDSEFLPVWKKCPGVADTMIKAGETMMWRMNAAGLKEFSGGTDNFELAAKAAANCAGFMPDDEDEQVTDDPISCYDCRYRRWQAKGIICMK
jgi:hypothetical protein